jgi:dipeptide/tripeptide permease
VLITWLYNNTGRSIFVAAVFHASQNVSWQLFPVAGSFFDPRVWGLLSTIAAGTVVLWWGPASLAGRRRPVRQLVSTV